MKVIGIIGIVIFLVAHPVVIYIAGLFVLVVLAVYFTGIARGWFKAPARITHDRRRGWSIEFM